MAVAAPARRVAPARAPAPKPVPARKPAPTRKSTAAAAAAARPVRARAAAAPARAPQRARPKPKRATGGQPSLAIAVGRTAGAVRHLPDSGLVVRMTRGRAWIGVLGVLLVGIVALNVVTLSFAASSGKIYQSIQALEQDNSILRGRDAQRSGTARIRQQAAAQGLVMPAANQVRYLDARPGDVATAARRLAAAGTG
ncbi:MAG TPA: hypothetical protein VNY83_08530 [Solirubrobacterales bacterium]|jgi:hypothetical protein|nr:hypothetical protein [Solirubrobacterales bacterium]